MTNRSAPAVPRAPTIALALWLAAVAVQAENSGEAVYGACDPASLAADVTVVVSVKDACSQGPEFLEHLSRAAPRGVKVVYTFPNFTSCRDILGESKDFWGDNFLDWPLDVHTSPMQGWLDVGSALTTPYAYLVHNDGYALDDHFLCELVQALKKRADAGEPEYAVAAPMLYESKLSPAGHKTLAAHATQTNLRLVDEDGTTVVRHDHSPRLAFRREFSDLEEAEQDQFLEDHGFLIETALIPSVIDPEASFTMEYIDMILSIHARGKKVLFVPSARLEFNVCNFTWRDIPYFMYKRSEATALGTRDYLTAKWGVDFPNTGFWTFIKYTIVEQHRYRATDADSFGEAWADHAKMAFAWFQMAGWNRYAIRGWRNGAEAPWLDVLEQLDTPARADELRRLMAAGAVVATRNSVRPNVTVVRPPLQPVRELLPDKTAEASLVKLEADMPLEYLPFAAAELRLDSCAAVEGSSVEPVCSMLIQTESRGCVCWINLPGFKSNSLAARALATLAGWFKVPARISTYFEMMYMDFDIHRHTAQLAAVVQERPRLKLHTCSGARVQGPDTDPCRIEFIFGPADRLVWWDGRPSAPNEVLAALAAWPEAGL